MKAIWIATAVLAAAITVAGCKNRREEPVPGPKATPPASSSHAPSEDPDAGQARAVRHHGASGISWFQGTFEEGFSCPPCTAMVFRH